MKTRMSIKNGMLTIKAEEDFIDFLKRDIKKILSASCEADNVTPEQAVNMFESNRSYFDTFKERCDQSYITVGFFKAIGLI